MCHHLSIIVFLQCVHDEHGLLVVVYGCRWFLDLALNRQINSRNEVVSQMEWNGITNSGLALNH